MIIYVIVFSIICAIISALGIKLTKKVFNPLTVFCGIWAIIFFFSSLQLYDIKVANTKTFVLLITGTVSYILGFLIDYKCIKYIGFSLSNKSNKYIIDYYPRYRIIYGLLFFSLLFMLYYSKDKIGILLGGGNLDTVLFATRAAAGNDRRTIKNVLSNLIVSPFSFAVFPICAYNIANKREIKLTFLVLFQMLYGILTSGGRSTLIYLIVLLCVTFTFSENFNSNFKQKICKINNKRFRLVVGLLLVLFIVCSFSRSGQKLIQHMYLYFSMQPVLFETWAKVVDLRHLYGFGEATFNGFTFHILYLIKNILDVPFPANWNDVFNIIIETDICWMPITNNGLPANAYVSLFWYYYLDMREFGVLFYSFLFGIITSYSFKRAIRYPNMKNICIYGMILFAVVDSYVRIRFAEGAFVAGMMLITFVLFKRKRVKRIE